MDGSTRNSPLFASPRSGMEPPWSTLHRCILPGTGEALKRRACPRLRRASAMVTVHIFIDPGVASRPRAFPFAYAPPAFASSRIGSRSGVARHDELFDKFFCNFSQVISARKGEFEAGYESGGQTREHVLLAKTLGVAKLIVVINKMDEPTVQWSKERYDEIEGKMVPFLKSSGYNIKKDVQFLPISGLCGTNMKTKMDKSICSWWDGPCLFDVLDHIEVPLCDHKGSVRMPIIGKYKDHGTVGTVIIGKLESGTITEGDSFLVMPNKSNVKVIGISLDERKVRRAGPGENVCVKLNGIEEEDIMGGFVLSSITNPVGAFTEFNAKLQILELLDNAVLSAGYKSVLHIHCVVEECEIVDLIEEINMKKMKEPYPKKKKPNGKLVFVKNDAVVVCRIRKFSDYPQLGRFTLRTEAKTIAVGKVVDVPSSATFSA